MRIATPFKMVVADGHDLQESPLRWIPFLAVFLYVYIEISIFIQVAHVLGVLMTLILVIFTSVIGMSLVRNQGFKNFLLMQQKMAAGESPAAEMIKSVSLDHRWLTAPVAGIFSPIFSAFSFCYRQCKNI